MIKRIFVIFAVALIFIFSFTGCSNEVMSPKEENPNNQEVEVVEGSPVNPEKESPTDEEPPVDEEAQGSEEPEGKEEDAEQENILYVSASKLNVRDQANGKVIGYLTKGAAVKIIGEDKNEAGEVEWYKIEFNNTPENVGWIAASYTVEDRMDLLGEGYRDLDLSPQNKVDEYPSNPRVEVKGIYLTIHSASNALNRLDKLIEFANETEINAFVIDVKDDYGNMLFPTEAAEKFQTNANNKAPIKDIQALIKKLKDNNIYTIARIVSFKDPKYAARYPEKAITYRSNGQPYMNRDGIIWLSPHDRQLWEYNIEVSKEAARAGFNEIQFDYVRFPASNGGKMDKFVDYKNELGESKPVTIQRYLKYAYEELSPLEVYISADIYGQVGSVADDMGLGQYWEAVSNVVDYVSPMMYPSHYGNNVYGLPVPDAYPYETIDRGIKDAIERNKNIETPAKIRPWIQDFTAPWVQGHIKYGVEEVKAQVKALKENGINEFMLWNPSNRYSEGAFRK